MFRKLADLTGTTARFNSRGDRIVTATDDGAVFLWDISGEKIAQLNEGGMNAPVRREPPRPSASEPDLSSPATSKEDISQLRTVEFSADGGTILAAYAGGRVQFFTSEGAKTADFRIGTKISAAIPSPDGTRVAILRFPSGIGFWNASEERVASFDHRTDTRIVPKFSPDGSKFLAVGRDKTATLWDVGGGKAIGVLRHDALLQTASFSASGDKILTSSSDGSIRVWDAGAKKLAEFNMEGQVSSVAFNADATQVLIAGGDAVVRIFNLYSLDDAQKLAAGLKLNPLTDDERQRLLVFETVAETEAINSGTKN